MVGRGPGRSGELPIDDDLRVAADAVGAATQGVQYAARDEAETDEADEADETDGMYDDADGTYDDDGAYDDEAYPDDDPDGVYDPGDEDDDEDRDEDDDEDDDAPARSLVIVSVVTGGADRVDDAATDDDGYVDGYDDEYADEPGRAEEAAPGTPLPAPLATDQAWDDEDWDPDDEAGYVVAATAAGGDGRVGLPPPTVAADADGATVGYDDEWYDYDEELEAYDGELEPVGHAWPPPEAAPLVPVPAAARTGAPSNIWAPGTAPGAWVPLGRPHFDNPLHALLLEPTHHRTRRRNLSVFSLGGLTNVLLLAYAAAAALLAAYTAALARQRSALQLAESPAGVRNLERSQQLVDATTLGVVGVFVVLTVANMAWCAVAARNQRMFADDPEAPPSPAVAGLGWIVPLANMVLPYRTLIMLSAGPFRERDASRSVRVWWVCWLASSVTAAYTLATARSPGGERDASWLTLVALLVTALFLLCFSQAITVFRGVARLQHDLAVERD